MAREPSNDPSVFDEPHLREQRGEPVACWSCGYLRPPASTCPECNAGPFRTGQGAHGVDMSVTDEPGRTPARDTELLAWVRAEQAGRSTLDRVGVTLAIVAAAAPWAVLGVWFGALVSPVGAGRWLAAVVVTPVVAEVMKPAALAWAVERRPGWFSSGRVIALTSAACGLAFGLVTAAWRLGSGGLAPSRPEAWLVALLLLVMHAGCSGLVGLGLARAWRRMWLSGRRPELEDAFVHTLAAACIHGATAAALLAGGLL